MIFSRFLSLAIFLLVINVYGKDVIENNGSCKINWTKGHIICKGESAEGQNKYAANLSAKVISQRNMLEVIKGVHITSEVTVDKGFNSSNIVKSRVEGVIKGAEIISTKYDYKTKSSIVVTKLQLGKDLLPALLSDPNLLSWNEKIQIFLNNFNLIPQAMATSYSVDDIKTIKKLLKDLRENLQAKEHLENVLNQINSNNTYTGILLDIKDIVDFRKALIVKLVDKNGKEIYPLNKVSKDILMKKNTSVGYIFGIEDGRKNKRVFANPIEMKPLSVYKNKKSNLVLSNEQIQQINKLDKSILNNAKVILVLGE